MIQEVYRTPNWLDQKRKNVLSPYNNHNENIQNKERILKAAKEKGQVSYKDRHQNYTQLLNVNHESQTILDKCAIYTKRPQMQAQITISSKVFRHHLWRKQGIPWQNQL